MLFCGIKFDKKFACLCFKFIKEILGWMSLNLLNFISRFLSKKCFLSAREILGFARSLAGFCHLALLCRSCKRYENFSFATHLLQSPSFSSSHAQNALLVQSSKKHQRQKISILLLKPRHSTICRHVGSFSKISIKSSKKVVCSLPQ